MADPKLLTRDQLAKFLPDAEAIKRFERLFQVAGDLTPADVAVLYRLSQEASLDANTAIAAANQALALLGPIAQDAAINAGTADAKAIQALDWLNRVADSLEWLVKAPPIDNGLLLGIASSLELLALAPSTSGTDTSARLAGGSAGSIPYQTAANTTAMLAIGTAAQVLQVNAGATAPEWVSSTGTGNVVRATSPTLITPTLGVASATSINKVTITAPAISATLTIANGKTLTASNSLTFAGTDGTTLTFPSTSATIARTDSAQSFSGVQTFNNGGIFNYVNGVKIDSGGTTLGQLYYSGGLLLNRLSGTSLFIQQNGSSEMVFTPNGDVQIGSSTGATYRLFVYKADNTWATFFVRQDGTADIAQFAGNGGQVKMAITRTGNIYGTAGSTGMTDGFFYIPAAGGAPTGVPTAVSGTVPMYYDTTNNKFYVYNGAWKSVTLT